MRYTFLFLTLFTSYNSIAQVNLGNGLSVQYLFNSNVQDNSGNSQDATAKGEKYGDDRNGKANSTFDMNGFNGYITLPENLQIQGDFTVSAWVKMDKHKYLSRLIEWGNGSNKDNIVLGLSSNKSGKPFMQIYKGQGRDNTELIASEALALNTWVHLVYLLEGNQAKIYKNGVLWIQKEGFYTPSDVKRSQIYIGKSTFSTIEGHEYPDGMIDDIYIYNRALNDAEVQALHKADSKPIIARQPDVLTPLNVEAKLDETGSINILYDLDGEPQLDAEVKVFTSLDNYASPLKKMSGHFGFGMRAGLKRKIIWYDPPEKALKGGSEITFKIEVHRPYKPIKTALSQPLKIFFYQKTAQDLEKERLNAQTISIIEDSISGQMTETFELLASTEKLIAGVHPKVKATIQETTPLESRPRYNLSVEYSYDIDNNIDATQAEIINYPSGKYELEKSQAASATCKAIKETVERYLDDYLEQGTIKVRIFGFTDAVNIQRSISYDNESIRNAPYFLNGSQEEINVSSTGGINTNSQLAYLRTSGIRKFLEKNISQFGKNQTIYEHHGITLDKDVGGIYRKVIVEVIIYDVFRPQ